MKVVAICPKEHANHPGVYPKVGTVGKVIRKNSIGECFIQWPFDSTSSDDRWWALAHSVREVI